MKLLTIVTINRNDAPGLLRTVQSVMPLMGEEVEYIVIDGASTDDSVRLVSGLIDSVSGARLISEPDAGIYNAMNKGLALATGEYIAFVNSGDELIASAYLGYLRFMSDRDSDVYYSRTFVHPEKGLGDAFLHERHPAQFKNDTIPHLTTAVKRSLLAQLGGFNEKYRIVADRDFFIRAKKAGAIFKFYDGTVARFYLGGISSGWTTKKEDALLNFLSGHISRASYYRKMIRYWLKQKFRP